MSESFKNCQSCGMPLKRDSMGGGTDADGRASRVYCSHCYRDGRFTQPDMTPDGMQALVKGKLREMGFPGFIASFFARRVPNLERWRRRSA